MPDDRGMLRPDESASVKDDDFPTESPSDPHAFDAVPADTTAGAEAEPVAKVTAPVVEAEDADEAEDAIAAAADTPIDGQESNSRLGKPAKAPEPKPKANKVPLAKRTAQLKHEVDTLTFQRREAERQLTELNRQIAERKTAAPTAPVAKVVETPAPAMPTVPKYRDFETDEAYEAAIGKYHTDLAAYHQTTLSAATTKLRDEIAQGVESRFKGAGEEAAFNTAVQRLQDTKAAVIATKPDWDEKRDALVDIQSAWYDPASMGADKTPFLTDVARTLLMDGNAEGGELLYWLGSDPDRAQAVADLLPTRPLRDAIVSAPSVIALLDHFATDAGQREFEALKQMHPIRMNQAIGLLSARLAGASSGSPTVSHPITKARPSARPPAGTPGARAGESPPGKMPAFDDWMKAEDAKELAERKRAAGIAG